MSTLTTNLHLVKPSPSDPISINENDTNLDLIDTKIGEIDEQLAMVDNKLNSSAVNIGDILETTRTDLDNTWLLCNGEPLPKAGYETLYEQLKGTEEFKLFHSIPLDNTVGAPQCEPLYNDKGWQIINLNGSNTAWVYDNEKAELTTVTCPYSSSKGILGIEWDGTQWVLCCLCVLYETRFYTSPDLVTWTLVKTYTDPNSYQLAFSTSYSPSNFKFDGVNFHAISQYSGYQGSINYIISADLETVTLSVDEYYYSIIDNMLVYSDKVSIYVSNPIGSAAVTCTTGSSGSNWYQALMPYSGNIYLVTPLNGLYLSYIVWFDKSTNTFGRMTLKTLANLYATTSYTFYCNHIKYIASTDEFMFDCYYGSTAYTAYIKRGLDLSVSSNYRIINSSEAHDLPNNTRAPMSDGTFVNATYCAAPKRLELSVLGSGMKMLPARSSIGAYNYIKALE